MLLKRLFEYSDRLDDLAPSLYSKMRIDWLIDLDQEGNLLGFVEQFSSAEGSKRGRMEDMPKVVRTSGVKPTLLADNTKYVLGWDPGNKKPERLNACRDSFLELARECHSATQVPGVKAVVSFLEKNQAEPVAVPQSMKPGENLTFRIDGEILAGDTKVQSWWADAGMEERYLVDGTCMLTGIKGKVLKVLPQPIKGIPGDQAEYYLISANSSVFESHGLEASQIAPLSIPAAERFTKALNNLLRDPVRHLRVGDVVYVFWTCEETGINMVNFLSSPDPDQIRLILKSPYGATGVPEVDTTAFYASAFSSSGSRVVVRDWIETTVGRAKENLARYFRMMNLKGYDGEYRYYGIYPLAACLYHDANRDMVANVPRALISCALNGTRLPDWLLFQAIKRNRAEQGLTRPRATLIKMILHNHYGNPEEDYMTELVMTKPAEWDQTAYDAYLCGRLLAVLDGIQGQAIPGAKATMLDRYYGTASSAPATIFGTLLRAAQNHLAKIRKDKKGMYVFFSKQMEEIIGGLGRGFPTTLNLKQQAMFSLGFYHQRAWRKSAADKAPQEDN